MSFLTKWLLSVIATAFLVSVCEALIPDKKVREVGKLIGGLLMLLALLSPLIQLKAGTWDDFSLDDYFEQTEEKEASYREQQTESYDALIKEKCATYIESAASQYGLTVRAAVQTGRTEEGVYQIKTVQLDIPYHAELSQWLTQELGVGAQNQFWDTKEMG